MDITSAQFIKGIIGTDPLIDDIKPQIAFIGRSNVGKSSVINTLVKRKDLVKSSSEPGKTKEINYFLINDKWYFVDLPGYGYAKVTDKQAEKIRKMILWYLFDTEIPSKKVIVILDAKVGITNFDQEILEYLSKYQIPTIIVVNKIDKLNSGEKVKQLKQISLESNNIQVVPFSAKTGEGRLELFNQIIK
jgi:GTP-binding protein